MLFGTYQIHLKWMFSFGVHRFQTHRIWFCCQNINEWSWWTYIIVEANDTDTCVQMRITFHSDNISNFQFQNRILWVCKPHQGNFRVIQLKIKENMCFKQEHVSSQLSQSSFLWCQLILLPWHQETTSIQFWIGQEESFRKNVYLYPPPGFSL